MFEHNKDTQPQQGGQPRADLFADIFTRLFLQSAWLDVARGAQETALIRRSFLHDNFPVSIH